MEFSSIANGSALSVLSFLLIWYVTKVYPAESQANRDAIEKSQELFAKTLHDFDRKFDSIAMGLNENTRALDHLAGIIQDDTNEKTVTRLRTANNEHAHQKR